MNAPSRSIVAAMAEQYGMMPEAFEATLRATVIPKNVTREQFAAFLLVAREHNLNPVTREIYAMPGKGGGIQPIVGVDGWCNIINSHPMFDGMEFADTLDDKGNVVSITCRIHRKDRQHPTEATEYLAECQQGTEPWRKWPRRMLRHKAMIQCARYAFSLAGIVDPDEFDRFRPDAPRIDVTPRQTLREKLTAIAGPREPPEPEPEDDDKDATESASPDLPSPYNTPEPTTYDAAEDVDETEPEFTIDPASPAYRKGIADGQEKTGRCRSSKVLADPEMLANWRAGYESVAPLEEEPA
jgi:phage recombination protein Bet